MLKDIGDGRDKLGTRQRHKIRRTTTEWTVKDVFKR